MRARTRFVGPRSGFEFHLVALLLPPHFPHFLNSADSFQLQRGDAATVSRERDSRWYFLNNYPPLRHFQIAFDVSAIDKEIGSPF